MFLGISLRQIPLLVHKLNEKFKDNVSRVKVFDKMKEVLYTLEKKNIVYILYRQY